MLTPQLAITLHQKPAAARQPLLATRVVGAGQVVPGQPRQVVMHLMQIEVEEQPAPRPGGFIDDRPLLGLGVGTVFIVGANHRNR